MPRRTSEDPWRQLVFAPLALCLAACMGGGQPEPSGAADGSDASADPHDALPSRDAGDACFCCSGARGALLAGDVGDAGDCSWCPVASACVHFVGGAFGGTLPPTTPDFVCATSVPNGGTDGPGSSPCQ